MVFVRLQPYMQISLKGHSYHKLSPKYFGPFKVLKQVDNVAYQLDLPPQAKIHHTFHASQLKKHASTATMIPDLPISLSPHGCIVLELEAIWRRGELLSGHQITQVLVKWFNCPKEDSTWMDLRMLQQQFPHFSP
ncbi:hypothetical protein A4A49_62576 [Nicotiana attenuata]|uniref:Tf2-1-like SH3-like domain-containing protein n=1 Tax=Nicotiana attenuata TaxID=49451 RepID=A0A1J6I290_NICAT|nr:hypothetical protein A4A49_62576 [Nicotiana attenuata]